MPDSMTDPPLWVEAGGDLRKLQILQRAGNVCVFSDPDGNRALAAIHPDRPGIGTIGDWVGSVGILRAAEAWLAAHGCAKAEGPALLAPWFPYRANLGPYDQPPMWMEPTERGQRWADAGYTPSTEYVSILATHDPQIKAGMDHAAALGSRGWRIDTMETGPTSSVTPEAFETAMLDVYRIATRAFRPVPGYLHVEASVVADFYRPYAAQLDPRLALIARDPRGLAVGFILGVPDPLQPERKWFQILSLGVVPEYRNSGVATWMVAAAHRAASRAGYVAGVHTLVRVDAGVQDRTWFRGDVIRRYALYSRSL
jgi:GNAT superfamily N-acetyltransferase